MKPSQTKMILIPFERYKSLLEQQKEESEESDSFLHEGYGEGEQEKEVEEFETVEDINQPPPGIPANESLLSLDKDQTQDIDSWIEGWISLKQNAGVKKPSK